jgi:hypothetical protein
MPRRDVANAGVRQPTVQFHRVDTWNAKDRINPVIFQDFDKYLTTGLHGSDPQ